MIEKICIILLLNLVFYFKTLTYKYSSDDIPVWSNPPKTRNMFEKVIFWIEGRYRSGMQVDHALTMLIHSLVSVFIYTGFGSNDISFIAAILFSFNPSNNQGTVWISGRSYAMAALGMTAAMTFPALSAVCIFVATYYNPGFLAPLVFIGSKYYIYLLFLPIIWMYHFPRFRRNVKHKMDKEMFEEDKKFKWRKLVLVTKTFGFYTALTLIPFKNTFYHSFLQSLAGAGKQKGYTMNCRFFWIGLAFIGAILWYWTHSAWNMASFGLLWWCICIAPFLNFMRMSQEIAERYIYLPSVGLMVAFATLLSGHPIITAFFIGMYATKMWFLMDQYTDDYYLCETACLNSPDSWFAWHIRGMGRWERKSFQEAVIIWTMARMISPREFKINFNIATALFLANHKEEALKFLKIAEENIPEGQEKDASQLIEKWRKGEMAVLL